MNLRYIIVAAALMSNLGCVQKQVVPEWTPPPIELNPDSTLVCDNPAAPGCAVETPFDELVQRSVEVKILNDWFMNFGDSKLVAATTLAHENLQEKVYNPFFR